ncbi:hypothetical protein ACB092_08G204000 [Castanea dentata]
MPSKLSTLSKLSQAHRRWPLPSSTSPFHQLKPTADQLSRPQTHAVQALNSLKTLSSSPPPALVIFNVANSPAETHRRSILSASDPRRPELSNSLSVIDPLSPLFYRRPKPPISSDPPLISSDPPLCFTSGICCVVFFISGIKLLSN